MEQFKALASCLAAALMLLAFNARATQPFEEYNKHVESAQGLTAASDSLMGDSVSLYNGATEFTATDISIPGNNALPVQLGRRFSIEVQTGLGSSTYGGIGNWDIDVPYISASWVQGSWPSNRCTQALVPSVPAPLGVNDVWHGASVHFPGAGDRKLLYLPTYSAMPIPRPTGSYYWTTASRDMVSCTTTMSGALSGDGFLLRTTDGVKYYFDVATTRVLEGVQYQLNGITTNAGRTQYYVLASKIEDRFGNTVNFAYNANGYPKTISSSDGRTISLFYDASGMRLDHASVNAGSALRTWSYAYGTAGGDTGMLTTVTLPDSSNWRYAHVGSLVPVSQLWDGNTGQNCNQKPPIDGVSFTFTIRHPGGAQGEFVLGNFRHPRSGVHINSCNPINQAQGLYKLTRPNFLDSMTLVSKTITGPGLVPREWTYDFPFGNQPLWGTRGSNPPFPCPITTCDPDKVVTVHEPDGTKTEYTYGYLYGLNEGRLLQTTAYDQNDIVQRVESTTYMDEGVAASQNFYGIYGLGIGDDEPSALNVRPVVSRTITQDGETYTWSVPKGCSTSTLYCFDTYGNPTKVVRSSTLGFSRTEQTSYVADTDPLVQTYWLLGLVTQLKCIAPTAALPAGCGASGTVMSETSYYAQYGLPKTAKSFGKTQQTLNYNFATGAQDGTLQTVMDGNSHTTTLSNWYRGVPRSIAYADSQGMSALVDDNGWITSVTDENGYSTGYNYDPAGRLSAIAYPTGDSTAWNPTTIVYEQSDGTNFGVEYGIPIGHWRRTESTGNSRTITYFDGMWRPIVKQQYDTSDATNTRSLTVNRYNTSGLQSFVSYPLATLTDWADAALTGTKTTYDALDRIRTSTQDSELGPLTTSTAYLSGTGGAYTQITNPRNNVTRISYQAYDQPSSDAPVSITQANGNIVTAIVRDPFGKPVSITRSNASGTVGATRTYTYNTYQELCRTVEPETGATLMGYDLASNLAWSAAGLPASTACDATGNTPIVVARKAARTYDARNRLSTLSFPDGRGNQTWDYTQDGLPEWVHTINSSNPSAPQEVINHYTYNHRRLPVGESSDPGSYPTLTIGYGYDVNGHLSSQVWPDGATAQFLPNALGQATRVDTGASNPHAWNAKYYPNGALKSFTYGNGETHLMEQNERGLPEHSRDSYSNDTVALVDDYYYYDPNGNIAAITDGVTGRGNRDMEYDEADRLTRAESPMFGNGAIGAAQFGYDALDNLTRVIMPATATTQGRNWYYCYDGNWQLTNIMKNGCTGGTSVKGLGYDVQGNVINNDGNAYDFDYGNRLRSASYSGAVVESYWYDAYGRRTISSAPGGTIQSIYSQGGQLLYQNNARTGKRINYYYLSGSLVNEVETTITSGAVANRYQHTDALGSPVVVTNGPHSVLEHNEYEPYGQVLTGGFADRPGYTGQVKDAATSMNYMQQRYYDPLIGRFMSVDPVTASSMGGNFNRYWYGNNNPYKFTDPDGRCGKVTGSMICGGAAGLAAMAMTAVVPKEITPKDVSSVGPQQADDKQVQTVVDDANKAAKTAVLSGDSRAVRAFNKLGGLKIDSSDWGSATYTGKSIDPKAIAFVEYDGGATGSIVVNSARYFSSQEFWRVQRLLHEGMHFDDTFYAQSIQEHNACPSCQGWDFQFERDVEVYAKGVFDKGW